MNINKIKATAAVALADTARSLELSGIPIIKLQTGDPDFDTHPVVCSSATKALEEGLTHYSFSQGLPVLRRKISEELNSELSSNLINDEWVLITNGAAEGIYSVLAALLEVDDEVIIFEPNWPTVDSLTIMLGGKTKKVSTFNSTDQIFSNLEELYNEKTKIICFNTPNNPTGLVYDQSFINAICNWAKEKNLYIVADEVYRFLQYEMPYTSSLFNILDYDRYIFVDSFSKKYAMTGWRIGYIAANPTTLRHILKASQLTITHVAPFIQMAALTAMTNRESLDYCSFMKETYNSRRMKLIDQCKSLNIDLLRPNGGFYLFLKIGNNMDDVEFCNRLLKDSQACIVPGSAFGNSGENFVRLSFANELEISIEGLKRIASMISKFKINE
jgi:aspartate aminotransferase